MLCACLVNHCYGGKGEAIGGLAGKRAVPGQHLTDGVGHSHFSARMSVCRSPELDDNWT